MNMDLININNTINCSNLMNFNIINDKEFISITYTNRK